MLKVAEPGLVSVINPVRAAGDDRREESFTLRLEFTHYDLLTILEEDLDSRTQTHNSSHKGSSRDDIVFNLIRSSLKRQTKELSATPRRGERC